jgi:hypothetical protein
VSNITQVGIGKRRSNKYPKTRDKRGNSGNLSNPGKGDTK